MIEIRTYRDHDREAVARLWAESWRSTGLAITLKPSEAELYAHNLERIPRELAAGWDVRVAHEDERLIGFLALKPPAHLDQIFVLPEAQRRGVGRILLDLAKAQLPNGFWLRTALDNLGACRFYERNDCRRGETQMHPSFGYPTVIYRWP